MNSSRFDTDNIIKTSQKKRQIVTRGQNKNGIKHIL